MSPSTRRRSSPRCRPGRSAPTSRRRCGRIGDGLHARPLAAVDGPVDGRRLARLPRRRPVLDPLREDRGLVIGLEVVLADGPRRRRPRAGRPRAATGPSLTQLFVGSEGTLGVITRALAPGAPAAGRRGAPGVRLRPLRRRARRLPPDPAPRARRRPSSASTTASSRSGASTATTPACSSSSTRPTRGCSTPRSSIVDEECTAAGGAGGVAAGGVGGTGAERLPDDLVDRWLAHRNDVTALAPLWRADVVVDTVEIAGPLGCAAGPGRRRRRRVDPPARHAGGVGPPVARLHRRRLPLLHLRRSPAGRRPGRRPPAWPGRRPTTAGPGTPSPPPCSTHGAAISHHHGIGLNRSRFLADALGTGFEVLAAVKHALDPTGILNPGKLGLPSRFGAVPWP